MASSRGWFQVRVRVTRLHGVVCCVFCMQEGELRPQLLDRFGMSVNVKTLTDVASRTQLVLDRYGLAKTDILLSLASRLFAA